MRFKPTEIEIFEEKNGVGEITFYTGKTDKDCWPEKVTIILSIQDAVTMVEGIKNFITNKRTGRG